MKRNKFGNKIVFICLIATILILSCDSDKSEKHKRAKITESGIVNKIPSVCIWDGIAFRNEPFRKSGTLSTLNLGESFYYLDTCTIDSTYRNQKYLRIELSDGSVGWAADFGLVINAKTGVAKSQVPVYKRPDLLTISNQQLSPMDIVAVTEERDNWYKFTGEKKRLAGWIKISHISMNEEDIAFASIVKSKLAIKDDNSLLDKIQDILDENPYPNSVFVETLNKIAQEEKKKKQLEEIMMEQNWNRDRGKGSDRDK